MANDRIIAQGASRNLNFFTMQKMIHRLLTEERIETSIEKGVIRGTGAPPEPKVILKPYTKEELAQKLDISLEDLENLISSSSAFLAFYESDAEKADKVSLSLIKLYCATKFVSGEYNGECSEEGEESEKNKEKEKNEKSEES